MFTDILSKVEIKPITTNFYTWIDAEIQKDIISSPQIKLEDYSITIFDKESSLLYYKMVYDRHKNPIFYEDHLGNWYDASLMNIKPDYVKSAKILQLENVLESDDGIAFSLPVTKFQSEALSKLLKDNIEPKLITTSEKYRDYTFVKSSKFDTDTLFLYFRKKVSGYVEPRISKNPPALRIHR